MIKFILRHLDPSACMAELLFGVIMTLTFTLGAGLVIEEGPDATRELLIGVIGCNIAWGVIDGLLYVFGAMYERGLAYRASVVLAKEGREAAAAKLGKHLEENYGEAISAETRSAVRDELIEHLASMKPARVKMNRDDAMGALASFILVVFTAVPAVLPFLVLDQRMLALRVSNFLLVGLIGLIGWKWASYINANRGHVAMGMTLGGLVLVQVTIMLGG